MKKLVLLAIIAAALVLTGCPNPAGGNPNNNTPAQVDYLARLIGTWQTADYDNGEFITITHPTDPSQHCKFKGQWVFTATTYTVSYEIKESTITSMPDEVVNDTPKLLYGVDAENYYTREKLNNGTHGDGGPTNYEIKSNALYVVGVGPLYKK